MAAPTAGAKQPSGRISRLISFLVMTFVLVLALYFMVRGAWWISVMLLILEIAFEGGYMQKKRRAASVEKSDAAI
jgi:Na+-driven multidrug efflux pump